MFAIQCLAFWFGAMMVNDGYCDFAGFFKALNALLFAAMVSGNIQSSAPDYKKAMSAARRIYRIIKAQEVCVVAGDVLR